MRHGSLPKKPKLSKSKPEYDIQKVLSICGSVMISPRRRRAELIQWLNDNFDNFEYSTLTASYGLFLNMLKPGFPLKQLVSLLVRLSNPQTVIQSRVNIVCSILEYRLYSPSIIHLLQVMSQNCGSNVYVPPLYQELVTEMHVPLDLTLSLVGSPPPETTDLNAAKLCAFIYKKLKPKLKSTDADLSDALSQFVPLIESCGRVISPVEEIIYEYLETEWPLQYYCQSTKTLEVIVYLFRFFDTSDEKKINERLVDPLCLARKPAAELIFPAIHFLGYPATKLMDFYLYKYPPSHEEWFSRAIIRRSICVYIFHQINNIEPAESTIMDIIMYLPGYLPLFQEFGFCAPAIKATLNSEFSLVDKPSLGYDLLVKIFGEYRLNSQFSIFNSPFLGSYPLGTFLKLKLLSMVNYEIPPNEIVEIGTQSLSVINTSPQAFLTKLFEDLAFAGFNIDQYKS